MINRDYINDMGKSELVLADYDIVSFPAYYEKMIRCNDIPNVLKFSAERSDGNVRFRYETDGLRPFTEVCEEHKPDSRKLKQLLLGIIRAVTSSQDYLIDEQDFLIRADCIFENRDGEPKLVCLPGYGKLLREQFSELFEFLMNRLDYNDKRAVVTLYELYRRAKETTCSFDDMRAVIEKNMSLNGLPLLPDVSPQVSDIPSQASDVPPQFSGASQQFSKKNGDVSTSEMVEYHAEAEKSETKKPQSGRKGLLSGILSKTVRTEEPVPHREEIAKTTLLYASPETSEFYLESADGRENINITRFPFFIGKKGANSDCELPFPQISRLHAKLTKDDSNNVFIEDLQSLNGCFVNNVRLNPGEGTAIKERDEIGLANLKYIFKRRT